MLTEMPLRCGYLLRQYAIPISRPLVRLNNLHVDNLQTTISFELMGCHTNLTWPQFEQLLRNYWEVISYRHFVALFKG